MSDPSRVRVSGPLEPYAAGVRRVSCSARGYRPVSARFQLRLMAHREPVDGGEWARDRRRCRPEELERFVAARRAAGYTNYVTPKALVPLLRYLRGLGVVPPARASRSLSAVEALLERYRAYLIAERGLAAVTARRYADLVRPFVASRLDAARSGSISPVWRRAMCSRSCWRSAERRASPVSEVDGDGAAVAAGVLARRGVDRRGRLRRWCRRSLAWRLSGLPRGLEAEQVQALLGELRSRETSVGRRDFAILLMLVRLGMRRGEVAALAARGHRLARRGAAGARQGKPGRAAAATGRCRRGARRLSAPRAARVTRRTGRCSCASRRRSAR